jgi:hypothetical protein
VNGENVFIAASGKVHYQQLLFFRVVFNHFQGMGQRVGGLQRRDDTLFATERFKGFQRFVIGDGDIIGTARAVQEGVLWPDGREIQPGRDRVGSNPARPTNFNILLRY